MLGQREDVGHGASHAGHIENLPRLLHLYRCRAFFLDMVCGHPALYGSFVARTRRTRAGPVLS